MTHSFFLPKCKMFRGGSFDLYCDICGLPFRPIDENERKTEWLNDAVLDVKLDGVHERVFLRSKEDQGIFIPKTSLPPKIKSYLVENNMYDRAHNEIEAHEIREHGLLCHEACEHRKDKKKVQQDLQRIYQLQRTHFEDIEYIDDEGPLHYLMDKPTPKPSTTKPKPTSLKPDTITKAKAASPKPTTTKAKPKKTAAQRAPPTPSFDKLTVKDLHGICEKLQIKKSKVKSQIQDDIRRFVCNKP